jgi:hypothetical protein
MPRYLAWRGCPQFEESGLGGMNCWRETYYPSRHIPKITDSPEFPSQRIGRREFQVLCRDFPANRQHRRRRMAAQTDLQETSIRARGRSLFCRRELLRD